MRRFFAWLFQFRVVAGLIMLFMAFGFMGVESLILARGAMRYAASEWDRWSLASVAGSIPWVIGLMPFLVALTYVPPRYCAFRPFVWTGRPSLWTVPIIGLWGLFVAYNIFGAGGAIAFARSDVVSSRHEQVDTTQSTKKRRDNVQAQLEAIPPKTRAVGAVEAAMATERARLQWEYSESCRLPTSRVEKKFCADYNNLKAELSQSQLRDRLQTQLEGLAPIGQARVAGWIETADPLAHFWAGIMGWQEAEVARYAPIATPVVLTAGSWAFLSFALILLGFTGHRDVISASRAPVLRAAADVGQGGLPAPASLASPSSPVFQFADRWLSECARPVQTGSLDEGHWYSLYSQECARSRAVPVSVEQFRKLAEQRGIKVTEIDGRTFYQRFMPMVA